MGRLSVLRHPLVQFLLAGAVVLVAVVFGTGHFSQRAATAEALIDARNTTDLLARSVAEPAIPTGLVDLNPGAIEELKEIAGDRLLVHDVRRLKIWRADGTIVFSDESRLIGMRFPLRDEVQHILSGGGTGAEVSQDGIPEHQFERGAGGLVEVYTRIVSPEGQPLLFEVYYSAADISARRHEVYSAFRPITMTGLLVLVAVTVPMLLVLTRRLARSGEAREQLLRAAVEASDSERRRIARDLHDGVVQDIAGTAFALSAVAGESHVSSETRAQLKPMGDSLRKSLRSLRSLLVEIYPPDLSAESLPTALDDLVAPATGAGVRASVRVGDLGEISEDTVALVWRVAQEAVRNALRHAHCSVLDIEVSHGKGSVLLRVSDDGIGFVPATTPVGRFGLRGLHDLIQEAGASLEVESRPGEGTTVRLEVDHA